MTASRIPDKTERSQQGVSFSVEYRRSGCHSARWQGLEYRNRRAYPMRNRAPGVQMVCAAINWVCSLVTASEAAVRWVMELSMTTRCLDR